MTVNDGRPPLPRHREQIGNRFLQPLNDRNRQRPRASRQPRAAQGGTLQQNNRQTGSTNYWRKRSALSGYIAVKRLGVGGLSESIKVVKERRMNELRVIRRVGWRARPKEELEILKRIPKGLHLHYMVEYAGLPSNAEIALVLEYCDLGDLAHKLEDRVQQARPFDEGFVWHIMHDVAKGLAYLHSGITDPVRQTQSQRSWDMICHLDIKPANVFLSSRGSNGTYPRVVLGDFGCAVTRRDIESGREEPQNHRHGTLDWMPPHSRGVDVPADLRADPGLCVH